jgi:hypothetical protein
MIEQMKYPFQDWIQQVPHDLRKNNKSPQTILYATIQIMALQ